MKIPLDFSTDSIYTVSIEKRLEKKMVYKVHELMDDDGFVTYAVVDTFDGVIKEIFYTRWDAEEFIIGLGV